jgi:predicted dehydrogenase
MRKTNLTRRDFMRLGAGATTLAAAKITLLESSPLLAAPRPVPPSDTVRYALIGTGIRGCEIIPSLLRIPGIECVAVTDLYSGSRLAAQEYFGKEIPVTKEYREILGRQDVDAVFATTPDHWHRRIVEEACAAGKDVYCEKPLSHTVEEGFSMVGAAQRNSRICQVGSQRVSSVIYAKAKEIYESGRLGQVTLVEAYWDRGTPGGAWVQPIPPDANEQTIDWDRWLGEAPKRPFDADRFFAWRKYADYSSGPAGDIFVHFLSGIHFILGINTIPTRAHSSGGLFRWKDGRDFPDLLWTIYDYPACRVNVRVNQNSEGGEGIIFFGTKATLTIRGWTLAFTPQDLRPRPDSYYVTGWPKKLREDYFKKFSEKHPLPAPLASTVDTQSEVFVPPPGYNDVPDHLANFFNAVRTRKTPVENEVFGNHVAVACHMANHSYFNQTVAVWDATERAIKG